MKSNSYILAILTAAGMFLVSSCNRSAVPDAIPSEGKCVSFSVTVDGEATAMPEEGTKATRVTTVSSFNVTAWNNDPADQGRFISGYTGVDVTSEAATTNIRWTKPYDKIFFAYANTPESGATVSSVAPTAQTLTYTVPEDAANQTDVLMGTYSGNGGEGRTANLVFKHALTAVEFYVSESAPIKNVSQITLKGVYGSGSITQSEDGTLGQWDASSSTSVSQTTAGSIVSGQPVGVPFILIPQVSASGLDIKIEIEHSTAGVISLVGKLPSVNWERGKVNKYYVEVTGQDILSFKYEIVDWDDVDGGNIYMD